METFEGQRIPGAAYSWSAPAGTTLPQDPAKPYLTATNKVGKYKVTVAFTGNTQTCQLETDISATPCQTFTDGSCTDAKTLITNTTPPVNINNLGVGDVFQAGDYDVTVTNISAGSQGTGWTGTGLVTQNLIGQIQMPLTVEFKNIKVNECYQYFDRGMNGAVVQTKVDETWSSVVSVDEIISRLQQSLANLEDVLNLYAGTPADVQQLVAANSQLDKIYADILKANNFTDDGKNEIRAKIAQLKAENQKMINSPAICNVANTAPSARVAAGARIAAETCPIEQAKNYIFDINAMLGLGTNTATIGCSELTQFERSNLTCHPTERGDIYTWMLRMTPGDYKNNFAEGQIAHHIIQNKYRLLYGGSTIETEYAIPKSAITTGNQGYADIVNFTTKEIFEVKTVSGEAQGLKEVELYVCRGNQICPPAGGLWRKGTNFPSFRSIWPLDPTKEIVVNQSQYSGVITYLIGNKSENTQPAPSYEPIPVATSQKIQELMKRLFREPNELERERMIRLFYAGLATTTIYAVITTGVVGDLAAVIETVYSGGAAAPAAILQASICTAFVVIGIQTLNSN